MKNRIMKNVPFSLIHPSGNNPMNMIQVKNISKNSLKIQTRKSSQPGTSKFLMGSIKSNLEWSKGKKNLTMKT